MANIKRKIELLADIAVGNVLKWRINFDLYVRKSIDVSSEVEPTLMVSLTSYGHRLRHSVQYTLYSLLKQKVRPAKIVLWTDAGEFADEPMPQALQVLQKYGVEIREYAPKIRSYKKLIPSLKEYPDFHHIIVDDDLFYSSNFVQTLYDGHLQHPDAIIALAVTIPTYTEDGKSLTPYKQWPQYVATDKELKYNPLTLMQLGYGGIFYPMDAFDEEVFNEEVYTKLCPIADDIWFYVQSVRLKIPKYAPIKSGVKYYQIDLVRQVLSKDRLHDQNFTEGQNNVQFDRLLEHYQLEIKDE